MLKIPPLQTATATIETLCSRLQSATLLEDRRSSILGLRSFAKQYPASVASGSLRELIATLKKDGLGQNADGKKSEEGSGDVDTIRLILETLLMLFKPDENSPEAGEEIAFFLADEFSMRQDNISMLLSLLDPTSPYADYYSRLYSIQILTAVCGSRPTRLQECILSAPLGVSRLVGILDDARDAIRNAGLLLLVDLTGGANEDLRKIVAFEDVFAKIFTLIQLEGGLAEAGITAQDCLSLLANLIGGSASNQTMFRESGCVGQLCRLLTELFPPHDAAGEAIFLTQNREKAGWGLLQLLKLFLTPGEASTPPNQQAFFRVGAAQILIDLAFVDALPSPINVAALRCAAELIQNNHPLQEQFAALTVVISSSAPPAPPSLPSRSQTPAQANGVHSAKGSARPSADQPRVYIIEGLLDMALSTKLTSEISLRASACALIQAYLTGHDRIKAHFLQRAIAGHNEQEDAANVLTTLLHSTAEPASIVFSSWIVQDIFADSAEAKTTFASVKEGNEAEGEDVITAIQAIGNQLHGSLQLDPVDERVAVSLASLLVTLLWDFVEGIDDLLAEGSGLVQSLILAAKSASSPSVAGFAAALLGVLYEFSTKDSPISRRTLAPLLIQKLGRNKYLEALLSLRRDPSLRDFSLDEADDAEGVLCATSVDLFLTEYSRLRKAIDKDPGIEVIPASAAEAGVDRDILDSLRQEAQASRDALAQANDERQAAIQGAEQGRLSLEKELQNLSTQVETLRKVNQHMQTSHDKEISELESRHAEQSKMTATQHQRALADVKGKIESQSRQVIDGKEAEIKRLNGQIEQRVSEASRAGEAEKVEHGNTRRKLQDVENLLLQTQVREKELKTSVVQLEREKADLGEAHELLQIRTSELELRVKTFDEREERLQQQLRDAEAQMSKIRQEYADLEEQAKASDDSIRQRDEELENERKGYSDLEKEVEAVQKTLKETKAALQKSQEEGKQAIENLTTKTKQVAELETQLKEAKTSLEKAKAEVEKANSDAAAATSKSQNANAKGNDNKKAKEVEKAKADTEKQLSDLQRKLDVSSKLVETLKEQSKKSQADLDGVKADIEKAREGEKSAKEELESMLLVMGEFEAKKDTYKGKVKELGGEVSEEEGDDDEEDEDEDEEEDGDEEEVD